jgi:hypothetical protein
MSFTPGDPAVLANATQHPYWAGAISQSLREAPVSAWLLSTFLVLRRRLPPTTPYQKLLKSVVPGLGFRPDSTSLTQDKAWNC